MKVPFVVLCSLLSCLGLQWACSNTPNSHLKRDMVHLDQVYIPVLALTNQNNEPASRKAIGLLVENWLRFKKKYWTANKSDALWQQDFMKVERMVAKANSIIVGGHDLMQAHETLEGIRTVLRDSRRRNHIDYFIDYLTDFHRPMEAIVLTVKNKEPGALSEQDVQKIQDLLPDARRLWDKVETAPFDAALFEFDAQQVGQMKAYVRAESAALSELQTALAAGDQDRIIQRAKAIKPNFAKLFMLFGDFDSVRS